MNKAVLRWLRKAIAKEQNPRIRAMLIYQLLGVGDTEEKTC